MFLLAFTSAGIILDKLLELHSKISEKIFSSQIFLFNGFAQNLNSPNMLSAAKVFNRCSSLGGLIFIFSNHFVFWFLGKILCFGLYLANSECGAYLAVDRSLVYSYPKLCLLFFSLLFLEQNSKPFFPIHLRLTRTPGTVEIPQKTFFPATMVWKMLVTHGLETNSFLS